MAHNKITTIHNRDIARLESLQELNVSGNVLRSLPASLGKHSKLQCLRANTNLLRELPDFKNSPNLKALDVGSNRLSDVSVTNLMSSQVNLLDISGNPDLMLDTGELGQISNWKKICTVDMTGQNRSLLDIRQAPYENTGQPWQTGLSLTSGMRNKLSVSIVNKPKFGKDIEGFFAIFDGGRTDEVTQALTKMICKTLQEELNLPTAHQHYLKYTMLAAHRKLKSVGQKVGAASAICHIRKSIESSSHYMLNVANVGDTEVIISRRGEAVPMSRLFLIHSDRDERQRICKSDGIVTEDGRVDGVTYCTRLIGGSYLFPHVLPEPHVTSLNLHPDDQLIIIANNGLWKYISYQDAVNEIIDIPDPVIAAKRLQDLAQGYGSRESIGVLVIRLLLSDEERSKMKDLLQDQFHNEQSIIAELREKDLEREAERKRRKASEMSDDVPMDIVKLKGPGKKRVQANELFSEDIDGVYVKLKYGPENVIANPSNWETILQRRLTEEVKNMELQSVFGPIEGEDLDAQFGPDDTPDNWTASIQKNPKHTVYPNPTPCKPMQATHVTHVQSLIEPSISTESVEFRKEYKMPINLDRDAVLFHEMQMARARSHGTSTDSMASTQSVPASVSFRDIETRSKSSSHSIEVLIRPPSLSPTQNSYGGSFPTPGTVNNRVMSLDRKGRIPGSCPDVVPQDHIDEAPIIEDENPLDKQSDEVNNKINERGDNFIGTKVDLIESCQIDNNKRPPEEEDQSDTIDIDVSVVSAYKNSKTLTEKKHKAPQPPVHMRHSDRSSPPRYRPSQSPPSSNSSQSPPSSRSSQSPPSSRNYRINGENKSPSSPRYGYHPVTANTKSHSPPVPGYHQNVDRRHSHEPSTSVAMPPQKSTRSSSHTGNMTQQLVKQFEERTSRESQAYSVSKNEHLKLKSKRAPLPPVSPEMVAKKYMEPLSNFGSQSGSMTLTKSDEPSINSDRTGVNGKLSPSREVILKTDVNSNSLTSLDDMFLLMKQNQERTLRNSHHDNGVNSNVQSTTDLILERSLSEQSVVITYL